MLDDIEFQLWSQSQPKLFVLRLDQGYSETAFVINAIRNIYTSTYITSDTLLYPCNTIKYGPLMEVADSSHRTDRVLYYL